MAALSSPPLFQTPCRSCPLIAKPDAVTNSAYRILVSSRLLWNLVQLSQSFGSVRVIWQLTNTKSLEGQTDPFPESPHHAASALYAISAHCEHKESGIRVGLSASIQMPVVERFWITHSILCRYRGRSLLPSSIQHEVPIFDQAWIALQG